MTTSPRTSLPFRGRPALHTFELSYLLFAAASRRNHAKIVSGCTIWQHSVRSRGVRALPFRVGVTEHPTAAWSAQRLAEAVADGDEVPRFLVHDRDSIFGGAFRKRVRGLGVRALITPPRSPKANAFCERVIGTIRRGCTDHVLFRDEHQAERVLREYASYYDCRPHRGLHTQAPDAARHLAPFRPPPGTRIDATPILAGLHHCYAFSTSQPAPTRPTGLAA